MCFCNWIYDWECCWFECRLASIFSELSGVYYREEGRRVKQRIEKKNVSSVELIVRYCFKVCIIYFVKVVLVIALCY
jgi:hypothetical protein